VHADEHEPVVCPRFARREALLVLPHAVLAQGTNSAIGEIYASTLAGFQRSLPGHSTLLPPQGAVYSQHTLAEINVFPPGAECFADPETNAQE
jgi:hypothetical protein